MAADTHATPFTGLTWEGRSVELGEIERELNRLWREVAGTEDNPTPSRSSVLNLVVYTTSDASAEQLNDTIGKLSGRHPLRAIVVSAEPEHQQSSLDTSLNTYCYTDPASGTTVCCEQVLVGANGEPANHLTGIVMPLLLPDLPLYLWWMGEPVYETANFTALVRSARKLIVDSSTYLPTVQGFERLLGIARDQQNGCTVNDLNWLRLAPWFEAVASFFDNPGMCAYLYGIEKVSLEYARQPQDGNANPAQPVLMAAWLYSRLGGELGHVELQAVETDARESGQLLSFLMETRAEGQKAEFAIRMPAKGDGPANACATVGDTKVLDRPVRIGVTTHPEMLDLALESDTRDLPYEEALELAVRLLGRESGK